MYTQNQETPSHLQISPSQAQTRPNLHNHAHQLHKPSDPFKSRRHMRPLFRILTLTFPPIRLRHRAISKRARARRRFRRLWHEHKSIRILFLSAFRARIVGRVAVVAFVIDLTTHATVKEWSEGGDAGCDDSDIDFETGGGVSDLVVTE